MDCADAGGFAAAEVVGGGDLCFLVVVNYLHCHLFLFIGGFFLQFEYSGEFIRAERYLEWKTLLCLVSVTFICC